MTDYDTPWKEALDYYLPLCLAFFLPQAHAEIDWGRGYEPLDKELQQVAREAEHGRRYVDKLVKVWLKSGEEQWLLIHIEVQTWREGDFARRMYVYNYRLFDRYDRDVVSLAILGDDNPDWRPDHFEHGRWGCRAGIQFRVFKLLDYAGHEQTLEADPNPFALLVLAHLKTVQTRQDPAAREGWKVRLVKGLYGRGLSAEDVRQLFRFIDWIMDLPPVLDTLFWQEVRQYEEEKQMAFITTPERIGRQEGLLQGIEMCLKIKFGAEGVALMPELRELRDHKKLEAVLRAIETASTPEELRRAWAE